MRVLPPGVAAAFSKQLAVILYKMLKEVAHFIRRFFLPESHTLQRKSRIASTGVGIKAVAADHDLSFVRMGEHDDSSLEFVYE
jgi:hypothetical protein